MKASIPCVALIAALDRLNRARSLAQCETDLLEAAIKAELAGQTHCCVSAREAARLGVKRDVEVYRRKTSIA